MKRRRVQLLRLVTGFFIFCLAFTATSAAIDSTLLDRIASDFASLSGYVVKTAGKDIIVDLDADKGLAAGDLLAVLGEGEKLVHPVTRKVIGTLDSVKAVARVTRVKQGYSLARIVGEDVAIKAGDAVRRYENIPAKVWDYTGSGQQLAARLQKALPALNWRTYDEAQADKPQKLQAPDVPFEGLLFIITANELEVRGPEFLVLHTYDWTETDLSVKVAPVHPPVKPSDKGREQIRYQPVFEGARTIGTLPGVTRMGDFILHNGLLLVTTDGSKIYVFEVGQQLNRVAEADTVYPGRILTVRWWQPEPDATPYLAVTTWADQNVRSMIFAYAAKGLELVHDNIPRTLGIFDCDGDGRPETLLGQTFDPETYYGRNIRQIELQGGKLAYRKEPFKTPRRFNVVGAHLSDLTGDGRQESVFITNGVLYIYNGKKLLYDTGREFGGSLSLLTYDVDPFAKDVKTTTAEFEIAPVSADLDGDGRMELMAVSTDRSTFTIPSEAIGVGKPTLAVVKYRDGRFVRGKLGGRIDGWIQGLTVSGHQVLCIVSEPGSLVKGSGSSHLVSYPLAD